MVSPIILVAASLGCAFLFPLFERINRRFGVVVGLAVLLAFAGVAIQWVVALAAGAQPFVSQTAGFIAPLSINLVVGPVEATAILVILFVSIAGYLAMTFRSDAPWHGKQIVLFFVLLLGSFGLVMTRDLFNVFVFMEISGIAIFGLLSTSRDGRAFEAGFKYMVASGLASAFFLIGVAFIYRRTGALNIADITAAGAAGAFAGTSGVLTLLFLLVGILVELKPAPANGWALDVYQAADPGVAALLSGVNATAMVLVLSRLLPLLTRTEATGGAESGVGTVFVPLLLGAASVAFVIPQVQALLQESVRRMLGYSSVAQVGLVVLAAVIAPRPVSFGAIAVPAALVLLLNHAVAKAGLFWLAELIDDDRSGAHRRWPIALRNRPAVLVAAGILLFALLGLPPFPGFWAKWNLVSALGGTGAWLLLATVLGGSLLEAVYLMRWFVGLVREPSDDGVTVAAVIPADFEESAAPGATTPDGAATPAGTRVAGFGTALSIALAAAALAVAGTAALATLGLARPAMIVVGATVLFGLFDLLRVPARLQVVAAVALVGTMAYRLIPALTGMAQLFALLFAAGALVQLIAFFTRPGRRPGLLALVTALILALLALTAARSPLELFLAWELMTMSSFLLVLRGRRAAAGALRYILFSLASAYAMLAALVVGGATLFADGGAATAGVATFGAGGEALIGASAAPGGIAAAVLLALAVLIKIGAVGLHVWLPATYAEAEDEVTSLMSSVVSKAGIFVFFGAAAFFVVPLVQGLALPTLLGWIGVATAIVGAMMALFQEDIKYTLAYSSMSQLGYVVLSFAAMSHLGWVSGLYLTVLHLMFKTLLFLAIAGVVYRTGTRLMYRMGGLIKVMPFSFIAVLIGIIAVSGVPPLAGFGGKWLLYTALLERGWYLQAALALFSSGMAFLYLFRLIHSIFLGQRKAIHDEVREAPLAFLIPQYLMIIGIMAISMFPSLLIKPLQAYIEPLLAGTVRWEGYGVISSLGYWNGNAVMYVTMGVFLSLLAWLFLVKGRVYRVKQFNIVYAAERPHTPESTHFAYNFFGHYRKAFGRLLEPWGERFWAGVVGTVQTISQGLRSWNTGNPQTYAFQIVLYLFLSVLVIGGGF